MQEERMHEREHMILSFVEDEHYRPMKIKEMAALMNVLVWLLVSFGKQRVTFRLGVEIRFDSQLKAVQFFNFLCHRF